MLAHLYEERNRDRIKSALGVAAFHAVLGYALLAGLGFEVPAAVSEQLKLINLAEEPPPPPIKEPKPVEVRTEKESVKKARAEKPEGAASPPNLTSTPTPIVAPPPEIRLPVPSPVIAAPVAGVGSDPSAGAADIPGPGTGSGGQGTGTGSGAGGSGAGGGGGGGRIRARWISGRIRDRDYPRAAARAGIGGTVFLRFVVAPDGRVSECRVTRSSGSPDLDSTTCRLILQRFRYRPARDSTGRPVPEVITGEHHWELGEEPEAVEIEPTIPDDE